VSIPAEGILLRLDARTGRRLARIELTRIDRHAFGGGPLAARGGIVWVAAPVHVDDDPGLPRNNSGWIARLDAATGRLRVTYVTDDPPAAVAAGPAGVWVSGGHTLRQVDPRTGRVVASVTLRRRVADIAVGTGAIWVAAPQSGTLLRIDPRTRRVVREVHVGRMSGSGSLALGSLLWAATDREVVGVDPRTGRVVQRVALPRALSIGVDGSDVWVYGPTGLYSVAPAGSATRRFAPAASAFGAVVARGGTIWLSDGVTQTLRRVGR
jgi:outer membrane protein assembly factor BamB